MKKISIIITLSLLISSQQAFTNELFKMPETDSYEEISNYKVYKNLFNKYQNTLLEKGELKIVNFWGKGDGLLTSKDNKHIEGKIPDSLLKKLLPIQIISIHKSWATVAIDLGGTSRILPFQLSMAEINTNIDHLRWGNDIEQLKKEINNKNKKSTFWRNLFD